MGSNLHSMMGDKEFHPKMENSGVGKGWGTKSLPWDGPTMRNEGSHPTMWNDDKGMGWESNPQEGDPSHDEERHRRDGVAEMED